MRVLPSQQCRINQFSKISKRTTSESREEGEASDGENSSPPSRNSNSGKKTRADRTAKSVEKGIQLGRQESSELIKELQNRIVEQQAEITGLKESLASREADHVKSTATITSLTVEHARVQAQRDKLATQVVEGAGTVANTVAQLSTGLAAKTKEVEKLTERNAQLSAQVAELARPRQTQSLYLQRPGP